MQQLYSHTTTLAKLNHYESPAILVVEQARRSPEEPEGWTEETNEQTASDVFIYLRTIINEETRGILAKMLATPWSP